MYIEYNLINGISSSTKVEQPPVTGVLLIEKESENVD